MKAANRDEWWLEYDSPQDYEDAMNAQAEQFWKHRGVYMPDPKRVEELLLKRDEK